MRLKRIVHKLGPNLGCIEIDLTREEGSPRDCAVITGLSGTLYGNILRDMSTKLSSLSRYPAYRILCEGIKRPEDVTLLPDTDVGRSDRVVFIKPHFLAAEVLEIIGSIWNKNTRGASLRAFRKLQFMFLNATGIVMKGPMDQPMMPTFMLGNTEVTSSILLESEPSLAHILGKCGIIANHSYSESIILLDRPETNLSPEHHATFIEVMVEVLSNNQLIIVTQSPLMLSALPNNSIHLLVKGEKSIKVKYPSECLIKGKSPDSIYSEFMGVPILQNYVNELLARYERVRLERPYPRDIVSGIIIDLSNTLGNSNSLVIKIADSHARTVAEVSEEKKEEDDGPQERLPFAD